MLLAWNNKILVVVIDSFTSMDYADTARCTDEKKKKNVKHKNEYVFYIGCHLIQETYHK